MEHTNTQNEIKLIFVKKGNFVFKSIFWYLNIYLKNPNFPNWILFLKKRQFELYNKKNVI